MPKQIRFTQLVAVSGKPRVATLWVSDPKADPEFKNAIEANRIVTIHMKNVGSTADRGEIGFNPGKTSGYLIFQRPLSMVAGTRVIGLKYNLLEDSDHKNSASAKVKRSQRSVRREKATKKGKR